MEGNEINNNTFKFTVIKIFILYYTIRRKYMTIILIKNERILF